MRALDPFLRNLNPILTGLDLYKNEITAAMANVAAATNARLDQNAAGVKVHYLRAHGPFGPESLATFPNRRLTEPQQRLQPAAASKRLASGLLNFDTRQCSSGITATLDPDTPNDAASTAAPKATSPKPTSFFERLKHSPSPNRTAAPRPGPGLQPAGPLRADLRQRPPTTYQHTFEQGG